MKLEIWRPKAGERVIITQGSLEKPCPFCNRHFACLAFKGDWQKYTGIIIVNAISIICPACEHVDYLTEDIYTYYNEETGVYRGAPLNWLAPLDYESEIGG